MRSASILKTESASKINQTRETRSLKNSQLTLLRKQPMAYGGELLKTRKARAQGRPLDTRNTMHLVLRSTKAIGDWSFKRPCHQKKIRELSNKFADKFGVTILSLANVGNHLHYQIKLSNRFTYRPFIRAITAAIAMSVTGVSRWNKITRHDHELVREANSDLVKAKKFKFWDYRPFTRVIKSFTAFLNLRDYIQINELEGFGVNRVEARFIVASDKFRKLGDSS